MIKIICIGKVKESFLNEAIDEYLKRLKKYTKIQIIELNDEGLMDESKAIKLEGQKILEHLDEKDYIITLEIDGKQLDSVELSKKIEQTFIGNSNIAFIIGGSYGLSQEVKDKSNFKLSFSKMTFPHQLFRVILLEQIYRSFKIINHESYHK